ncbi:transposon Tf2-9 polyprotein [Trichonephila clavipes]|nr:transposon Tf2-9 polyprotein [Trichonephila clavipes]
MYGLNGAPAIWQRYVDGLFQGMDGVKVFMDDARITGSDEISHFTALEEFFKKCREHGLKLNLNKTTIANPLHNLTKKNVRFLWSKDCQVAFEQIKKEICSPKILVHYDPSLPLTLASDASPVGIGCVLSHVYPDGSERPIAFASRTLSGSEKKYSQIDKEALSIVWAVRKFYLYLKGRRFTLITDHKPLIAIFGSKRGLPVLAATRLLHYALILQSFEFDIIFRKTIEHGNADFLSRLPKTSEELEVKDDITIFQMSQIEALPVTSKELRQETSKDIELGPLLRALREGKDLQGREAQYTIEDGCIMYGQRVCIPRKFRKNVLEELHAGHLGIVKMKAIARSFVYWKNIDNDIEEAAKNCVDCARYKADPPKSKVHYWEYPSMPWERIHVDFAGPIF